MENETKKKSLEEIRNYLVGTEKFKLDLEKVEIFLHHLTWEEVSKIDNIIKDREVPRNDIVIYSRELKILTLVYAIDKIIFKDDKSTIDTNDKIKLENFLRTLPNDLVDVLYFKYEEDANELLKSIQKKIV